MLPMTIGTNRSVGFTSFDIFAMNTLPIIPLYVAVTLAAGLGNIEMIYRRFGLAGTEYPMRRSPGRMAVITGRCNIYTAESRLAVNAALINLDRFPIENFMLFG